MKSAAGGLDEAVSRAVEVKGVKVLTHRADQLERGQLRTLVDNLKQKLGEGVVVLASAQPEGKVAIIAGVTPGLVKRIQAGKLVGAVAKTRRRLRRRQTRDRRSRRQGPGADRCGARRRRRRLPASCWGSFVRSRVPKCEGPGAPKVRVEDRRYETARSTLRRANAVIFPHDEVRRRSGEDRRATFPLASRGTRSTPATCPGGRARIPTPSGSPRSCCSRRAWPWSSIATRSSWSDFPRSLRWRWRPSRRCWRCGAAWATTAARACCTRRRSLWPGIWEAICRCGRASCAFCRASAPIPPRRWPASRTASRWPWWMAMWSACCAVWRDGKRAAARAAEQRCGARSRSLPGGCSIPRGPAILIRQ